MVLIDRSVMWYKITKEGLWHKNNLPATFFTDNFGIRTTDLEKVLDAALGKKADYADLFFEYRRNEGVSLEEGLVKNCSQSTANGVGVRVLAEARPVMPIPTISPLKIWNSPRARPNTSRRIDRRKCRRRSVSARGASARSLSDQNSGERRGAGKESRAALRDRQVHPRLSTRASKTFLPPSAAEYKVVLVANSQGLVVGDIQPLTRLNVTCIVEENGNRQIGSFGGGGRVEFGFFVDDKDYERYAREAVRQAVLNLERDRCARRHDGRCSGSGLAGHPPPRSDRPRPGRRF